MELTVRLRIGGSPNAIAYDDVLRSGEVVGLLGPSGAGKTSVLLALAGLRPVEATTIRAGQTTWTDTERGITIPADRRRMAVVFQDNLLFPHLDVIGNVAFGPRSRGVPNRQARMIATSWLERLGIRHLAGRPPTEVSGGEGRRVALARALASDPAAIALDEPTAGLDVETRHEIRTELRRHLVEAGIPAMVVTHDPSDVMVLADRVVVLEHGVVTQRGTLADLTARPRTQWIARLAGTNLWRGQAEGDSIRVGTWSLQVADGHWGPVLATVAPRAITLSNHRPDSSARNMVEVSVRGIEPLGGRVRVALDGPVRMVAEVTPDAVSALGLTDVATVWASIKATEVDVYPA